MKKRTRITAEMIQQMKKLRIGGKSAKEIAAVIGVSVTAVKKHTAGIKVAASILKYTQGMPRRNLRDSGCRRLDPAQRQAQIEAIRRMYAEGKTYIQISAETGANSQTIRNYTRDLPRRNGNKSGASVSPEKPEQPKTGQPGTLCRHKETCRYWRPLSGLGGGISACHYPIDRDELRPWPADQCPGFPGPKTGPNTDPMGIKRKE